ncbi:Gfo/Idh/MocA family oxidoreductase [Acidobacteriota bacterium]
MEEIKIVVYGVGAMGRNVVRLLQSKPRARIVGAIDHDPAKIGRDVGDVTGLAKILGVDVLFPLEKALDTVEADLVIHTTTAFLNEAYDQILNCLGREINVLTICQELFFPIGKNVTRAQELDKMAKEKGLRMTAVGVNPGFVMDLVPILCSLPCWEIESVFVRRIVDFSPYGPDEMRHIGANLTQKEFLKGVREGTIGHIGLLETTAMVAHCLGFPLDELRQTKEPLLTRVPKRSEFIRIEPGRVCGFKQNVTGLFEGKQVLDFRMVGIVSPDKDEDGVETGDYTRITGVPNVDITIKEEIAQKGGLGTAGVAVNMIPKLMNAQPGFHTMNEFSQLYYWNPKPAVRPVKKISFY